MDMAESFNLENFKTNAYKKTLYDPTNLYANAEANMAAEDIKRAEEAVKDGGLLSLTLKEKMAELGVGERVAQQLKDTAIGIATEFIDPLADYLEKYEKVFDQNVYNAEFQGYAKQMFFAHQAMSEEAAENVTGQKFMYNM